LKAMGKFGKEYFSDVYAGGYEQHVPPKRIHYYLGKVMEAKESGALLDVGCAYGLFLSEARRHFNVIGCDVSEHAVGEAARRLEGVEVINSDVFGIQGSERFDVVTCFDVLEHLGDPKAAMARIRDLLRPDGILALTVPVYDTPAGWLVRLLDRDTTHIQKKSRRFWRDMLRLGGFRLVTDTGLWRYTLPGGHAVFFGSRALRNFSPAIMLIGVKE